MVVFFNVQISTKCKIPSTSVEKSFFKIHYDLQGHLRLKVKVPNESQIMTSYLKLIVNVCLSGTILKISAIQQSVYYLIYLTVKA